MEPHQPPSAEQPRAAAKLTRWPRWPFVLLSLLALGFAAWWSVWGATIRENWALARLRALPGVQVSASPPFAKVFRSSALKAPPPPPAPTGWREVAASFLVRLIPPPTPDVHLHIDASAGRGPFAYLPHIRHLMTLRAEGAAITDDDLHGLRGRAELIHLALSNTSIGDAGLAHLTETGLHSLRLTGSRVTDRSLADLARIKSLQALDLERTSLDGSGLSALRDLPSLSTLNLGETRVTETSLHALKRLRALRDLTLSGTAVTDALLETVGGLPDLHSLSLDRTSVSDAGLAFLTQKRPRWERLSLRQTRVTSEGLRRLAIEPRALHLAGTDVGDDLADWLVGLSHLRELDLSGTRFTDAGLESLYPARHLQSLNVEHCRVSDQGVLRLFSRARIPDDVSPRKRQEITRFALDDGRKRSSIRQLFLEGTDVSSTLRSRLADPVPIPMMAR